MKSDKIAVIFDMDGVIVQNDYYHCKAWQNFCNNYGMEIEFDVVKSWFGNINRTILQRLFGNTLTDEEIEKMSYRKEEIYREIYVDHVKPVAGLRNFLEDLKNNNILTAVATSAPRENVDFVMEKTGIRAFFDVILDSTHVTNGKPFPEIYLKTAEVLDLDPSNCLVIEDSFNGIESGNRAGMKVIGLATTHKREELKNTVLNIQSFTELNVQIIRELMN